MHHAHFLAVPLRRRVGLEGQVALLGDWEAVHVGAQRDHRPGPPSLEHAEHTSGGNAGSNGEPKPPQFICDEPGGPCLSVAELGILVKVTPPLHHLRIQFGCKPLGIGG
jgi:hypothetical protein